jgi:Fe-S cluster biogenesis protein NfuA
MTESADAVPTNLGMRLAVQAVLEEIRPAIQMDGGDVELVDIEPDGRVIVRLLGACTGCAMSQMTLKQGIENLLMTRIAGVTSVDAATESAS